jgi:broad specificity phosphatase PhoE
MQDFYLIRHGETDWNIKLGKLQGHTDIPLNEKGERQAAALGPLISHLGINRLYSSDLIRAQTTARLALPHLSPPSTSFHLREVHLGIGEGLTWEQVIEKMGPQFRTNWSSTIEEHLDLRFPGGESRREVINRIQTCLHEILDRHPGDKIAFVTHGYVIRTLVYFLSDIQENFFVPNCALVPFTRTPDRKLIYKGPNTVEELLQPRLPNL